MFVDSKLLMKSQNIEFLTSKWSELAGLSGFAGAYAHSDAVGAISKLRMFCEQVVKWIHHEQRLPKPFQANLSDLLANQPFHDVVPEVVQRAATKDAVSKVNMNEVWRSNVPKPKKPR